MLRMRKLTAFLTCRTIFVTFPIESGKEDIRQGGQERRLLGTFRAWAILGALVLIMAATVPTASASKGKPVTPGDLRTDVIIDYAHKPKHNPGGGNGGGGGDPKDNTYYEQIGSWASGALPVEFRFDRDFAPAGSAAEIAAALQAWDDATSANLATLVVDDTADLVVGDGINSWTFRLLAGMPQALGVTFIRYLDNDGSGTPTAGDDFVEMDVSHNTKFKWGIDPDGEGPQKADAKGRYYDVRNIATHEAGHALAGLNDLYLDKYSDLTMYGVAGPKETKKVSLEDGDKAGTVANYGP